MITIAVFIHLTYPWDNGNIYDRIIVSFFKRHKRFVDFVLAKPSKPVLGMSRESVLIRFELQLQSISTKNKSLH